MISNNLENETKWEIDLSHSDISFNVKHLMISNVVGRFTSFKGSIITQGHDFSTSKINLKIDVDSVSTGDEMRDTHLRGIDFFNTSQFTTMFFLSNNLIKSENEINYVLIGELTIKDVTKPIELNVIFGGVVTDPYGIEKAGFSVKGSLLRSAFGLQWNTILEAGGVTVGDEVSITCEIELRKVLEAPSNGEFKITESENLISM